jgi:hypothetical protein
MGAYRRAVNRDEGIEMQVLVGNSAREGILIAQ